MPTALSKPLEPDSINTNNRKGEDAQRDYNP
jgi:hypothetical protein